MSNKPEQRHTEGAQAEPWFAYASEQPKVGSEDVQWRFANWLIAEARHERDEAQVEVKRLRSALERLLVNAERIFDQKPVRDWDETLHEALAALHPDEEQG